jgi:putative endonuclease
MTGQVWYLYIVRCGDGSLYSGVTVDIERRLREHGAGGLRGAKYLRGRGPLQLAYMQPFAGRSAAQSAEAAVKKMSKREKELLLNDPARNAYLPVSGALGMMPDGSSR